jgi:hypothetical protein
MSAGGFNPLVSHAARAAPAARDPERVTLAFDNATMPVLFEKLGSDNVRVVTSALGVLSRQAGTALSVVKAVSAGIPPRVIGLMKDSHDAGVRRGAAKALELMTAFPAAQSAVARAPPLVAALLGSATDADPRVRESLFLALLNIASGVEGCEALVGCGGVPALVKIIPGDGDPVCAEVALAALVKLVNCFGGGGATHALDCGATGLCTSMLSHAGTGVREQAAACIGAIAAFSPAGKTQAIRSGAVPLLLGLLRDGDHRVRAAAAGALMAVAIDDDGKRALSSDGVPRLVACLTDGESPLVRLNAMRTVASLAALPAAREKLLAAGAVDALRVALAEVGEGDALLAGAGEIALGAVQWKP